MKKNLLIIVLLTTVGLFAESKAEFSIVIRAKESTVKAGSGVVLVVNKTNLTKHVLPLGSGMNPPAAEYTYDVRRDGTLVAETESAKKQKEPPPPCKKDSLCVPVGSFIDSSVPPHQTITDEIQISDYRDMSQPGKYTIQLQQDKVKSNVVTVTVEP